MRLVQKKRSLAKDDAMASVLYESSIEHRLVHEWSNREHEKKRTELANGLFRLQRRSHS